MAEIADKFDLIMVQLTTICEDTQALRKDFNTFAQDMSGRVAALEVQMKQGITGNGTPSRMKVLEDRVESLMEWRWWLVGAAVGCTSLISVFAWVIEFVKK